MRLLMELNLFINISGLNLSRSLNFTFYYFLNSVLIPAHVCSDAATGAREAAY